MRQTRHIQKRAFSLEALQTVLPVRLFQQYAHRKVIQAFASSIGLVYFGFVDQHTDEHELVRGFTLSVQHRDNHYCVGSAYGYDMILVERTDHLKAANHSGQTYGWIILQVDLRSNHLPHAFITPLMHSDIFYETFFIKYSRFQELPKTIWKHHDDVFREHFSTFTMPESAEIITKLFSRDLTASIGQYFNAFEIEIQDDKLLFYMSNQTVTQQKLELLLKNGLWLASQLDASQALIKE